MSLGTVSGGVNIYAGQTSHQALVTWTGNSNLCHQGSGAITGRGPADSWWVSDFLWSCQVGSASIWTWDPTGGPFRTGGLLNSSVGTGSTVTFTKNDVQGAVTSYPASSGTPGDGAFPTDVVQARWLVNGVQRQGGTAGVGGSRAYMFGGNAGYGYPAEYYWYRLQPLEFSWTFTEPGPNTVQLIVDYANGSQESVSGVVTVTGSPISPGTPTGGGSVSRPVPAGSEAIATAAPAAVSTRATTFPIRVVQRALRARLDCVHDRTRCVAFFLSPAKVNPVRAEWARTATLSLRCEGVCPGADQRKGETIRLAKGGTFSPRLWGARMPSGKPSPARAFDKGARLVATLVAPGIRLTAVMPVTTASLPFMRSVVERSLPWTESCALSGSQWSCPQGTTPSGSVAAA